MLSQGASLRSAGQARRRSLHKMESRGGRRYACLWESRCWRDAEDAADVEGEDHDADYQHPDG
jgi:hypothetical protein